MLNDIYRGKNDRFVIGLDIGSGPPRDPQIPS